MVVLWLWEIPELRCIAQPDAAQAALLERLGIVLPKRMRGDDLDMTLALTA